MITIHFDYHTIFSFSVLLKLRIDTIEFFVEPWIPSILSAAEQSLGVFPKDF